MRDRPAHAAPQLEADLGQLRRLARPGLAGDDHDLVIADRRQQVLPPRRHGQRLRVGDGGHGGAPARDPLLSARDVALEPLAPLRVPALEPLQPAAEAVLVLQRQLGEARPQRVTGAGAGHPFQVSAAAARRSRRSRRSIARPQRRMRRRQAERAPVRGRQQVERVVHGRGPQVGGRRGHQAVGDLHQRRGQRRRVAGHAHRSGVGGELAVARERARADRAGPADRQRRQPAEHELPALAAEPRAALQQRLAGAADDGHHRGVVVDDVRQLMGDHGLELARLERLDQAAREVQPVAAADGALDPAVGQRLALEHDRRLRQVRHDAQALDDGVQLGRGGGREPRAARGDRDPVTRRDADADAEGDHDQHPDLPPRGEGQHPEQRGADDERGEQRHHHHPDHEPEVPHPSKYCAWGTPAVAGQCVPRPLRAWNRRARAT